MRVSEYGNQRIRPRDFWTAIALVSALLVGVGWFTMGTGQFSKDFHAIGAAVVALGWLANFWGLVRRGRKHFSLPYLIFFVGYSLFFAEQLTPSFAGDKLGKSGVASLVGAVLMFPFILLPYVDFGRRRLNKKASGAESQ